MDEVARVRVATRQAVDDITPPPLRDRIQDHLRKPVQTPGVLTRLSAKETGIDGESDELDQRTAGVQLIYGGLYLTRSLIQLEPWTSGGDQKANADHDILASNVMVARGAYLLARTDASDKAVEIIREFGRDQTLRYETNDPSYDENLELDLLELAVIAGGSIGTAEPSQSLLDWATGLADSPTDRRIPEPDELLVRVPASDVTI